MAKDLRAEFGGEFATAFRTMDRLIIRTRPPKGWPHGFAMQVDDPDHDIMFVTRMVDAAAIEEWRQDALDHGRWVEGLLGERRITIEFATAWGCFLYACGMVNSAFTFAQDDPSRKAAGKAGGEAVSKGDQRKWVSRELIRRIDSNKKRHEAEADLAKTIRAIIKSGKPPKGLTVEWLSDLLNKDNLLKDSYCQKRLPMKSVLSLAKEKMKSRRPPLFP